MALGVRFIQRRNYIGLQLLAGSEGLSEFDFTLGPSTITGACTFTESNDTSGIAPEDPVAVITTGVTDDGTTTPDVTLDVAAGQSIGSGWVTVMWFETNQAAGAPAFDIPITITKAEGADGSAIATIVGPDLAYRHVPPTAAQAAEHALLDMHAAPMGLSAVSAKGRRHYSEYSPSAPVGPFGVADASVVNANLNSEEISSLIRVGFLSRGTGANSSRLFLTEAGKRSAGFPLA